MAHFDSITPAVRKYRKGKIARQGLMNPRLSGHCEYNISTSKLKISYLAD